ncbi:hypothetical protein BAE44_0002626, partial [Dichanthelium oligosanthes]
LEIILVDVDTGLPVALRQALRLELVQLDAEFPPDGREDWSHEEFQENINIVKEREGWRPLLTGDVSLTMRDGCAVVGSLKYTHNYWPRGTNVFYRYFRIGARVVPGTFDGARVHEAITDPITILDYEFRETFGDGWSDYLLN